AGWALAVAPRGGGLPGGPPARSAARPRRGRGGGPAPDGAAHAPPPSTSCSARLQTLEPTERTVSGTVAAPEGITDPPIDDLLEHVDSKYALVIYSAKRARQINAYYSQLSAGLLENVGPLLETRNQEKPLSIAMREINAGLLTIQAEPEEAPEA